MGDAYELFKKTRGGGSRSGLAPATREDVEKSLGWGDASLGGFLSNLGGGVLDIGKGLGSLAVTGLHDAGSLAVNSLTAGQADWDYKLDDLAKAMPGAIAQDYGSRYGSVEGFLQGLYEEPLAFVGDALTVATAGGYGAAKAAQAGALPARAANKVLPGLEANRAAKAAGVADSALPKLGGTREVLNPLGRVETVNRAFNPVNRAIQEGITNKVLSRPVGKLEKEIAEHLEQGTAADQVAAGLKRGIVNSATEAGIERVLRPSVAKVKLKTTFARMMGEHSTSHIALRDQRIARYETALSKLPEDQVDSFHLKTQGLEPIQGARLSFDEVERAIQTPPDTPMGQELSTSVQPVIERIRRMEAEGVDPTEIEAGKRLVEQVAGEPLAAVRGVSAGFIDESIGTTLEGSLTHVPRGAPGFAEEVENLSEGLTRFRLTQRDKRGQPVAHATAIVNQAKGRLDDITVVVDPALRGQGVGSSLLQEALRRHPEIDIQSYLSEFGASSAGEKLAQRFVQGDELGAVVDEVRLTNFSQEASKFLEAGGSFQTLLERAYKPMHFAQTRRWDFEPGEVFALDDAVKMTGHKAPVYFPHIDTTAYSRGDFLLPWRLFGMRGAAKNKGFKRSEGKLMERYMEGQRNAYQTNPREAYALRAAQVVRTEEVTSFIDDMTRSLGRPITARDQVARGEVPVNLDGIKTALRTRLDALEEMSNELEVGASLDDAYVAMVERAFANIEDNVAQAAAQQHNLWAVPKTVGDKMKQLSLSRVGGAAARLMVDAPNNLWRSTVLYWSPRFYVNNIFGNTTFLKLQGGKFNRMMKQMDKRYKKAYDELPPEVKAGIEGTSFHSSTGQRATHLGAASDTKAGQAIAAAQTSPIGYSFRKGTDYGRRFNNFIENTYRKESFLKGVEGELSKRGVKKAGGSFIRSHKRLEQLFEAGADPKIYKGALDSMNDTMNNYAALGPIERNIVRRFFMPFWAFYKHSTKTLVKMPYSHPAKARMLQLFGEADREFQSDEMAYLPEWLQNALPAGSDRVLTEGGMNPFAGVAENPLAAVAPMLQVPLETAMGRDIFTDRKFTSPDTAAPFGTDQRYKFDPATGQPVKHDVRPALENFPMGLLNTIGQQFPQVEMARDLLPGAGARYSTGETITDESGAPLYPTDKLSELLRFFGIPISAIDLESFSEREREEAMRALETLRSRGLAP